eukprot:gene10072-12347_t
MKQSVKYLIVLAALFSVLMLLASTVPTVNASDVQSDAEDKPIELEQNLKSHIVGSKTDDESIQREEEAISSEGYSVSEKKFIEEKAEKFQFQAEVNKLMNIIINSLYSKKEIFLRELISNASDALDKIRFLALTNPALLGEGDQAKLEIMIKIDKANKVLHIIDRGIGMTKDDLIKNLGTIAQSGTKDFIKKLTDNAEAKNASNLIGQFGVGFYSLFLVADSVIVTSKHNDDDQYIWTSTSDSDFSVIKDPKGNTLGRGTRISLHLKDDCKEFLDQNVIRDLAKKYSQFINFPISLYVSKEVEIPAEEQPEETKTEETKPEDEVKVEEGEEEKEEETTEKTEPAKKYKTEYSWEELNDAKPIWVRSPKEITKEEYNTFYQSITKDTGNPIAYTHFVAEGDTEFRSILYIPKEPPQNMFDLENVASSLRLFVRRVFITDNLKELVPNWLRFLAGIIDSNDLPLNVSREMLQQHKILDAIRKKIVRKFIQMIQDLSKEEDKTNYQEFFKKYGTNVKLGVIEDSSNKEKLIKLLMFPSSKSEWTSFEDYVSRMKEGQEQIYFIAGNSKESVEKSPLIEQAIKRGYEVLYLVDPIDEYTFAQIPKYDKYKLTNLAREGVKFDDKEDTETNKAIEEEYKPLKEFLVSTLKDKIEKVTISKILADSPCVLVSNQWGVTANMERIMKAQSFANPSAQMPFIPKKVMEINPDHPLIKQILSRLNEFGKDDEVSKISANVLYETSALTSGYNIENPTNFSNWIYKMMLMSGEKLSEAKYETEQDKSKTKSGEPFFEMPETPLEEPEITEEFETTPEETKTEPKISVPAGHDEL